ELNAPSNSWGRFCFGERRDVGCILKIGERVFMRAAQKVAAVALGIGLAGTIYGIVRVGEAAAEATEKTKKAAAGLVDQTALENAHQLAQIADSDDEKAIAENVLKIGDRELDLAFDIALRNADAHPMALSPEAKTIQARLQKAQRIQESLQA